MVQIKLSLYDKDFVKNKMISQNGWVLHFKFIKRSLFICLIN